MGMSTHVKGFKPPDDKWRKMKAAYEACQIAGIDPPEEVEDFFAGDPPDDNGVEVDESALAESGALRDWKDEYREGFEIDVPKLPPNVTVVRFYNSW